MTRLPFESRNVVDRPDLPEYELNAECAAPGCHLAGAENHHLSPRSFGTRSYWVELEDGTVVGNRVGLCNGHHGLLTVNNARITFKDGVFWWLYHGEVGNGHELDWQPPTYDVEHGRPFTGPSERAYLQSHAVVGDTVYDMNTHEVVQHLAPQPGETCEKCKRRVPHAKKASSPQTKVFSIRVPIEDKALADADYDADSLSAFVDDVARHHGILGKPHHRYWTVLCALAEWMQAPQGDLPFEVKRRG